MFPDDQSYLIFCNFGCQDLIWLGIEQEGFDQLCHFVRKLFILFVWYKSMRHDDRLAYQFMCLLRNLNNDIDNTIGCQLLSVNDHVIMDLSIILVVNKSFTRLDRLDLL